MRCSCYGIKKSGILTDQNYHQPVNAVRTFFHPAGHHATNLKYIYISFKYYAGADGSSEIAGGGLFRCFLGFFCFVLFFAKLVITYGPLRFSSGKQRQATQLESAQDKGARFITSDWCWSSSVWSSNSHSIGNPSKTDDLEPVWPCSIKSNTIDTFHHHHPWLTLNISSAHLLKSDLLKHVHPLCPCSLETSTSECC